MNNRKFRFGTLLMFLAAMTFALPCLTSCEYFVDVYFNVENPTNDTSGQYDNTIHQSARSGMGANHGSCNSKSCGQYGRSFSRHFSGAGFRQFVQ